MPWRPVSGFVFCNGVGRAMALFGPKGFNGPLVFGAKAEINCPCFAWAAGAMNGFPVMLLDGEGRTGRPVMRISPSFCVKGIGRGGGVSLATRGLRQTDAGGIFLWRCGWSTRLAWVGRTPLRCISRMGGWMSADGFMLKGTTLPLIYVFTDTTVAALVIVMFI
ncbi:MAG: hypothetical protein ACUVQ2_00720 [Dissulfurimicrobium sp.]|uniref:hypothetical protein n=1 Tax=Dissulfurimicrobium sp. TaxID=2022436 RepID=UPI004049A3DE